jgi:hypothetical protein
MMYERRWPIIAAAVVGALIAAAIGWTAGRSTAPNRSPRAQGDTAPGAIRLVDGIPIGVEHSRAGALAAADNYVARAAETIVQDPPAFTRLVRTVWAPSSQARALSDGKSSRSQAPDAVANYAAGGRGLAMTAARKLERYDGTHASVLSWGAGFIWGPEKRPTQRWFLARTRLVWTDGHWSVAALDELPDAAPTPYRVIVGNRGADSSTVFEDRLQGMSAPVYGSSGEAP